MRLHSNSSYGGKVMKKGKLLAALICSASMVMGSVIPSVPAMADGMKVVTLGADLSDAQKNTMLKYFQKKKLHLLRQKKLPEEKSS